MRFTTVLVMVGAVPALMACETTTEGAEMAEQRTVTLSAPPEYMSCEKVPTELAIADARALELGVYDNKGAYWAKRSERLASRSYECKTRRR